MARRRWRAEEKAGIVLESLAPGVNVAELCRRHQVSASQVYGWRERFLAGWRGWPTAPEARRNRLRPRWWS